MESTANASALSLGHTLGEYRIDAVLGQGGFGITYLATDNNLGTRVAIKEFFPASLARRDENSDIADAPEAGVRGKELYLWGLQQFLREARALAQFKHQNIVRVLRYFEAHNTAYMVMEYEQGQSLAHYLATHGNKLTEQELLRVFLPILNGLQAIHDAGLLHLDIKPDNIYLRQDGSPMLIDFGSARQPTSAAGELQPITLTPAYAALEQYPDQGAPGPWTDVYALGASMFRCVTGISPAGGLKRAQAIQQNQPDPLASLARVGVPDFAKFVLQCIDWAMEIAPPRRPQSAQELQEGLLGRRRPPQVPSPPRPAPAPSAEATTANDPDDSYVDRWKAGRWLLAGLVILALAGIGFQYWGGSGTGASEGPREQISDRPSRLAFTLIGHSAPVRSVAFLDGDRRLLSSDDSGQVLLWDPRTGQRLQQLADGADGGRIIAATTSGGWFAVAAGGGIDIRGLDQGDTIASLPGPEDAITRLAASNDGKWVAAGDNRGNLLIQKADGKGRGIRLHAGQGAITGLAFSANGSLLATGDGKGSVALWDVKTGQNRFHAVTAPDHASALALSPDGNWIASGGQGGAISLWNPGGRASQRSLQARVDRVESLAFSPDGMSLYVGLSNNAVAVLDRESGSIRDILTGQNGAVQALALSPDGLTLATGGRDLMVLIWSAWGTKTKR
jgi:serine/threonine protein kinase